MTDNEAIELLGNWIYKNICYSDFQYCGKAKDISRGYGKLLFKYLKKKGIRLYAKEDIDDMIIRIAQ